MASSCGTLMTHRESIALIDEAGLAFTPELKAPEVLMPFAGFDQQAFASRLLDDYIEAKIDPSRVFPQSFDLRDIEFWLRAYPEFARQAVYLDPRGRDPEFQPILTDMQQLHASGVRILAPPMPMLLTVDETHRIQPSAYALLAREAGLQLITWTLESGRVDDPANWMYASVRSAVNTQSGMLEVLHVLARDVGIRGIFSDWPGTVTYYANCYGL
jgi:glycerophosphoryl diester phosphodiesterase